MNNATIDAEEQKLRCLTDCVTCDRLMAASGGRRYHNVNARCLMKTMTVRNIPDVVADWLSHQAEMRKMSINQTTVAVLSSVALPSPSRKRRDLHRLYGNWTKEEASRFEANIQDAFGSVNPLDWEPSR